MSTPPDPIEHARTCLAAASTATGDARAFYLAAAKCSLILVRTQLDSISLGVAALEKEAARVWRSSQLELGG